MIIIIVIPNILFPVLDYQFNVVVDGLFATKATILRVDGLKNRPAFYAGQLQTQWITYF